MASSNLSEEDSDSESQEMKEEKNTFFSNL